MSTSPELALALRHARIRWVGAPLLLTGLAGLLGALLHYGHGASGWNIPLGLFGSGMALASFGANSDTALVFAWRASQAHQALPGPLAEELAQELQRDRAALLELKPAPTVGLVLPVIAVCVQALLAWRLLGG